MATVENKNVNESLNKKDEITHKLNDVLNSQEFKNKYIVKIGKKGREKEAILADGLRVLANIKGIKNLTTEILQYPSKENAGYCIVQATLVGYDINPINNQLIEVVYSAIGDACLDNCGELVRAHFIRMAETRSVSRVFRNYTNVAMVAFEELGDLDDNNNNNNNNNNNIQNNKQNNNLNNNLNNNYIKNETNNINNGSNSQKSQAGNKAQNPNGPMTDFQKNSLIKIIKEKKLSQNFVTEFLKKNYEVSSLDEITYSKAFKLLRDLAIVKE